MVTAAQIARTLGAIPSQIAEKFKSKPEFRIGQQVNAQYTIDTGLNTLGSMLMREKVEIMGFNPFLDTYKVKILESEEPKRVGSVVNYEAGKLSATSPYWSFR